MDVYTQLKALALLLALIAALEVVLAFLLVAGWYTCNV